MPMLFRGGSLGNISSNKDKLKNEIEMLSPLPDGIKDDETFISCYETVKNELITETEKKYKLLEDLHNQEKEAPDESSEELENQQKEAETEFQNELRKGKSVASIRDLTQTLLAEMDSGTY